MSQTFYSHFATITATATVDADDVHIDIPLSYQTMMPVTSDKEFRLWDTAQMMPSSASLGQAICYSPVNDTSQSPTFHINSSSADTWSPLNSANDVICTDPFGSPNYIRSKYIFSSWQDGSAGTQGYDQVESAIDNNHNDVDKCFSIYNQFDRHNSCTLTNSALTEDLFSKGHCGWPDTAACSQGGEEGRRQTDQKMAAQWGCRESQEEELGQSIPNLLSNNNPSSACLAATWHNFTGSKPPQYCSSSSSLPLEISQSETLPSKRNNLIKASNSFYEDTSAHDSKWTETDIDQVDPYHSWQPSETVIDWEIEEGKASAYTSAKRGRPSREEQKDVLLTYTKDRHRAQVNSFFSAQQQPDKECGSKMLDTARASSKGVSSTPHLQHYQAPLCQAQFLAQEQLVQVCNSSQSSTEYQAFKNPCKFESSDRELNRSPVLTQVHHTVSISGKVAADMQRSEGSVFISLLESDADIQAQSAGTDLAFSPSEESDLNDSQSSVFKPSQTHDALANNSRTDTSPVTQDDRSPSTPATSLIDVDHLLSSGVTVAGFKPRPIIRKRRKVMIPLTQKDVDYWRKRKKNNDSAKRSREAKKEKEKNFYRRALELEYENYFLRERLQQVQAQLQAVTGRTTTPHDYVPPTASPDTVFI